MFKMVGAQITECRMTATVVVKALNEKKNIRFSLGPGLIMAVMGEFRLKGTKEAFHGRIIETISDAAHTSLTMVTVQDGLI